MPDLTTPLITHLLQRAGVPAQAVDALILGNALGANGNPARLAALSAGLPDRVAAWTLDSQCCAGLDAITHACALLALGQADIVIAGGAEAWSRAPIRQHRPRHAAEVAKPTSAPPLPRLGATGTCSMPQRPIAGAQSLARAAQEAWAVTSHARALASAPGDDVVPVAALLRDAYPRALTPARAARMPVVRPGRSAAGQDCSLSTVAISPKADGAALLLLASPAACQRWQLQPRAHWLGAVSVGAAPETPMLAAQCAALAAFATAWPAGRSAAGAGAARCLCRPGAGLCPRLWACRWRHSTATAAGWRGGIRLGPRGRLPWCRPWRNCSRGKPAWPPLPGRGAWVVLF